MSVFGKDSLLIFLNCQLASFQKACYHWHHKELIIITEGPVMLEQLLEILKPLLDILFYPILMVAGLKRLTNAKPEVTELLAGASPAITRETATGNWIKRCKIVLHDYDVNGSQCISARLGGHEHHIGRTQFSVFAGILPKSWKGTYTVTVGGGAMISRPDLLTAIRDIVTSNNTMTNSFDHDKAWMITSDEPNKRYAKEISMNDYENKSEHSSGILVLYNKSRVTQLEQNSRIESVTYSSSKTAKMGNDTPANLLNKI